MRSQRISYLGLIHRLLLKRTTKSVRTEFGTRQKDEKNKEKLSRCNRVSRVAKE